MSARTQRVAELTMRRDALNTEIRRLNAIDYRANLVPVVDTFTPQQIRDAAEIERQAANERYYDDPEIVTARRDALKAADTAWHDTERTARRRVA